MQYTVLREFYPAHEGALAFPFDGRFVAAEYHGRPTVGVGERSWRGDVRAPPPRRPWVAPPLGPVSRHADGTAPGSRPAGSRPRGDEGWDCDGRACPMARDSQDDRAWYARALAVAERACRGLDVDPGDLVAELWIATRGAYVTALEASALVRVRRENAKLARTMYRKRVVARQRSWVRMMIDDRKAQRAAVIEARKRARAARNLARDLARRDRVQRGEGQRGGRKVAPVEAASTVAVPCTDGTMLAVARVASEFAPTMRELVDLRMQGFGQCEIAELTGQNQSTVSRKLAKVDAVIASLRA